MPFKSKAQARLMYAAAAGKSDKVPQSVGQEFVNASRGMKFSKLKDYLGKKKKEKKNE